jgi:eukaryotic-like serine/threonine-protein kinase
MPLVPGTRLGPYEILAPIGAGGMGEVYRAKDTKLKREVALKILPDAFASDPDRMARFRREAQVLGSLNHPNIAQIYGVEDGALVMELVDGVTLPSPLPIDTALNYARQMAEGLEYANERGVIHRDLKPANVKVTPEGVVKLLDFGLAKAIENPSASSEDDPGKSPTLTLGATRVGVILGTAAYMSPEQASGKTADRRADIWSFGAVLYELLSGKRAFVGESASDTLATVLKLDPDWNALPAETPASIRRLIRRCLTKDRKRRLQAIGEARIAIEESLSGGSPETVEPVPGGRSGVLWAVSGVLAAALAMRCGPPGALCGPSSSR